MKKQLILFAAGAGLFGAGYLTGSVHRDVAGAAGRPGPLAAAAVPGKAPQAANGSAAENTVRAFVPGRPFAKGQAKEWLLSLYAGFKDANDWMGIPMVEAVQALLTIDDDCAAEVIAVLTDPSFKDIEPPIASVGVAVATLRRSQLNPGALLAALKESSGGLSDNTVQIVFSRLVKEDVTRAAGLIEGLNGKARAEALDAVLGGMTVKDPVAALALADKYPDDVSRQRQTDILSKLVEKDPQQGVAAAVKLAETGRGGAFIRHVLTQWHERDKSAAFAWAESYAGAGQTDARAWRLERRADENPSDALTAFKVLQQSTADPKELADTAGHIALNLAEKDLPAARDWALSLPPGPLRIQVLPRMVERWVEQDTAGASEWISTLPPGDERDDSAAKLASSIKHSDPPAAFEWARNIEDEDQRTRIVKEVTDVWRLQNAEAAKAAVNTLPEKLRRELPEFK